MYLRYYFLQTYKDFLLIYQRVFQQHKCIIKSGLNVSNMVRVLSLLQISIFLNHNFYFLKNFYETID